MRESGHSWRYYARLVLCGVVGCGGVESGTAPVPATGGSGGVGTADAAGPDGPATGAKGGAAGAGEQPTGGATSDAAAGATGSGDASVFDASACVGGLPKTTTQGCSFDLGAVPPLFDRNKLTVVVGGSVIAPAAVDGGADGWLFDPSTNTVLLIGAPCTAVREGAASAALYYDCDHSGWLH